MAIITREDALKRLRQTIDSGQPIVGCGAGTGISAKFAERGGADLIIIYNSGRYRMAGRGSLAGLMPYGDANGIVVEMASEVLPVVQDTPVLAGVCGTDPFRLMPVFIKQLKEMGFSGVQNFPTVGLMDGDFRANLEATGMGYDKEVEAIAIAHELDMLTTPYVFNPDEAMAMAEAGADLLVAHVGLTTAGSIGAAVAFTGGGGGQGDGHRRGGAESARRHYGHLPRWPLRRAGERGGGPGYDARHRRLFRRLQHRALAHRAGHHRTG
jgi:predicted TIM-barrel enzyme